MIIATRSASGFCFLPAAYKSCAPKRNTWYEKQVTVGMDRALIVSGGARDVFKRCNTRPLAPLWLSPLVPKFPFARDVADRVLLFGFQR